MMPNPVLGLYSQIIGMSAMIYPSITAANSSCVISVDPNTFIDKSTQDYG